MICLLRKKMGQNICTVEEIMKDAMKKALKIAVEIN